MQKLIVEGSTRLNGHVNISGSKNSALPILAATLLTREECVIHRVPDLSDTNYMLQILRALGADVERASGTVRIKAANIIPDAPYDLVRKMRASICVMGPLTGRLGKATVSMPGGCVIGDRPVDLHLKGLEHLGATVEMDAGNLHIEAKTPLRGCAMNLLGKFGSTVLGTDNVLMAAVLTEGQTIIDGAAAEPEVEDLANFLVKMGAKIEGIGTTRLVIEGVKELHGVEHVVIPDRIEAGTFLVAGAICGDKVTVGRVNPEHLRTTTDVLKRSGYGIVETSDTVTITPAADPVGFHLTTRAYPGFPTDMQAQFCALACTIPGPSSIRETIFPQRFMHVSELKRMGAYIELEGDTARITGVEKLSGAPVMASDLRASAALVLAALHAKGTSEVHRLYHIDRGYEHLDDKFAALGAKMSRVQE